MDPVCEEKINFLQKYIPFLANLIELLANDSGKEGKLAQMQLLYNLLNKPDKSVKIETLEKCEEVLSRVFGNADEKCNEAEMSRVTSQNIFLEQNIAAERGQIVEISQIYIKTEEEGDICEQINGYKNEESNKTSVQNSMEREIIIKDNVSRCVPESVFNEVTESGFNVSVIEAQKTPEFSNEKQEVSDKAAVNNEDAQKSPRRDLNEVIYETSENENIDQAILQSSNTDINDISMDDSDKKSSLTNNDMNLIETKIYEDNECILEPKRKVEDQHEIKEQIKGSKENVQNNECDTFILPDDGEIQTNTIEESLLEETTTTTMPDNSSCKLNTIEVEMQADIFIRNQTEILPFKIISAESLATSADRRKVGLNILEEIDTEKDPEDLIDTAKDETKTYDPLDPMYPSHNFVETVTEISLPERDDSISLGHQDGRKYNDDDDDDVLLIETRSSPICIDSDPDDEESMKQNCPISSLHTKITNKAHKAPQKSKTIARKSTSIVKDSSRYGCNHQTVPCRKIPSHRKTKEPSDTGYIVKRDPKLLMETINLIDSDSDEEVCKTIASLEQNDDDVIIIGSSSQKHSIIPTKKTSSVLSSKQGKRIPPRPHHKLSPKPTTAQSNFLNAVNLQPTPETSPNPTLISSQMSSKRAIIPNALHTNLPYKRKLTSSSTTTPGCKADPSSNDSKPVSVSVPQVQDRMLKEWLEGFLTNFASPLQVASHACFVLLQRVLKYRFFQRLKVTRLVLNMRAKNCEPGKMDVQMLLDLKNIFIQDDILTEAGRRFCRFATNDAFGKPVALTTDARTGKVTCRTRIVSSATAPSEISKTTERATSSTQASQVASNQKLNTSTTTSSPTTPVPSSSTLSCSSGSGSKKFKKLRKLSDGVVTEGNDDNDYTPYMGELVLEDEIVSERKKSLRTNRTKRKEAGFTYSEDHDDEEFEALAKKIEDKKREELRLAEEKELEKEREKEKKVKKTVAKKTTSKRQSNIIVVETDPPKEPIRKKLRLADAEILGNADDDLLTPTWVEADGDDDDDAEVDSLLDFAETPQTPETHIVETDNRLTEDDVVITQSSEYVETYPPSLDVGTNKLLKNTSRNHHTQCQKFDFCVHCLKRVPRIVHHYVNEHRSAEVFTSRLRTRSIRRLLTTSNVGFVHLYKGNQQQYAAHCIFCDKEVKFLLPYWFEHFTMHTGEYSFKCSGCNIRKPTRSLLANHLQSGSGCPKKGAAIKLHTFDTKSNQIEAHICTICNYVQLHRKNVLRHLLTQHEVKNITPNHIIKVVLLQVSGPYRDEETIKKDESKLSLLQSSDDEEAIINGAPMTSTDENSLLMQNDFTDNDDLSFMICGMLDVQTNLSATGNILGNDDKTNSVDK